MSDQNDEQLLWQYATKGDRQALGELASRYLDFVYSAALRQVRDPHMADDVTQAVFLILAQKAGSIRQGTILPAWLFNTVRYASANAIKMEARRRKREQQAAHSEAANPPAVEPAWEELAPVLDGAIARLGEGDRGAILLRYFRGLSLREVGLATGVSEQTAQKRLSRAVAKLRKILAGEGITVSAVALPALLSAHGVQAAPASMAASLAVTLSSTPLPAAVAAGGAASATTSGTVASSATTAAGLAKGTLIMMTTTQIKFAAVVCVALLLTAGTGAIVITSVTAQAPGTVTIQQAVPGAAASNVGPAASADINDTVGQLVIGKSTREDVIRIFGEPTSSTWNSTNYSAANLPSQYVMVYPGSFRVMVSGGRVSEVRFEGSGEYVFRNAIRIGSTVEEVLKVLGEPGQTLDGKALGFQDGVLYRNANGRRGYHYYSRRDQGIRIFFVNDRVGALYLTETRPLVTASDRRALDEKIAGFDLKRTVTREDVIKAFGPPLEYAWQNKTYQADQLPETYRMSYPGNFAAFMRGGSLVELRLQGPSDYAFEGSIRLGSTLAEVLKVLGPPAQTVERKPMAFKDGVLYKDADGMPGRHYYCRPDRGIRLFFNDDRVVGLCLLAKPATKPASAPGPNAK